MQEITVRGLQAETGTFTRGLRRGERFRITDRGEPLAVAVPWKEWQDMTNTDPAPLVDEATDPTGDTRDEATMLADLALGMVEGDAEAAMKLLAKAILALPR